MDIGPEELVVTNSTFPIRSRQLVNVQFTFDLDHGLVTVAANESNNGNNQLTLAAPQTFAFESNGDLQTSSITAAIKIQMAHDPVPAEQELNAPSIGRTSSTDGEAVLSQELSLPDVSPKSEVTLQYGRLYISGDTEVCSFVPEPDAAEIVFDQNGNMVPTESFDIPDPSFLPPIPNSRVVRRFRRILPKPIEPECNESTGSTESNESEQPMEQKTDHDYVLKSKPVGRSGRTRRKATNAIPKTPRPKPQTFQPKRPRKCLNPRTPTEAEHMSYLEHLDKVRKSLWVEAAVKTITSPPIKVDIEVGKVVTSEEDAGTIPFCVPVYHPEKIEN